MHAYLDRNIEFEKGINGGESPHLFDSKDFKSQAENHSKTAAIPLLSLPLFIPLSTRAFLPMKYHRILALSPADHHQTSTWRPWSLRPLSLFAFPVLFLLLCIALELIVLGCDGGCDVFGALSAAEHSRRTTFAYNLLPTIGTVALSLLWALPHHNVMRLEPYFQMSTPGGAKAVDSIFLKYPYIFAMFVPYQAWKHR